VQRRTKRADPSPTDSSPRASARGSDARSAHTTALKWLAQRELSEVQVRLRLRRRGFFTEPEIDAAISSLKSSRALDDARTARAYVRTVLNTKARGRARLERDLEELGIRAEDARGAVDEVFGEIDENALLERALARRWPRDWPLGRPLGEVELARIYRALVRQGFAPHEVAAALRRRGMAPLAD
jgi:SOS response regulatory protein OraA/RecX